jgi:hypothetical protein
MKRLAGLCVALLAGGVVLAGCGGGSDKASTSRPCVVAEDDMANMLEADDVIAAPQKNGYQCLYASQGKPIVSLYVRTPEQFDAERAKFEDNGILLPELVPVEGFDGQATIDPRHNSLNVSAEDLVVSVELVGTAPAGMDEQVALETRIARAALEQI